jgi:hypothetical protein
MPSLTLGLDYNGVLTHNHTGFRKLAKHFDKVIVVSATNQPQNVRMAVKRMMVDWEVVTVPSYEFVSIPKLKLQACREHHIDVFIDDMESVCSLLNKSGILGLRYVISN